jgi:UPF0042 nucleotide-binding protein
VETRANEGAVNLAVAVDARSANSLASLPADILWLKEQGHLVKVLFLTAKTESLINRFSETRRSHPLSHRLTSTAQAGAQALPDLPGGCRLRRLWT